MSTIDISSNRYRMVTMDDLLTSGLWSDCIFIVGSETNQELIQAHKLILAMASSVFEAMFYGWFSERNDPIVSIPDVQPEAFRALLEYIYTDNINIGSLDSAWDILYGAKKYMLPHLEKECDRYICSVLEPNNVCQVYEIARFFDDKTIMDECLKIISTNTKEVLNDSSFEDVELNTVITVCSLDHLNVDSELDLFNAVARYAKAEQRRKEQISAPEDEEPPSKKLCRGLKSATSEKKVLLLSFENSPAAIQELESKPLTEVCSKPTAGKQNLKEEEPTIRAALQKIRFLSMTEKEFMEGPARSGLLTEAESSAVHTNINHLHWPESIGFSDCRHRRQLHSYSMRKCLVFGCFEQTINALESGDPSLVEEAARALADGPLCGSKEIQLALDRGILDALVPALTEEDINCNHHAVNAILDLCGYGTPSQLRVMAESAALEPYCRLLATCRGITCSYILSGIKDLLKKIEQNSKLALNVKLRELGVPQLLMQVQQSGDECERYIADIILQTYFSGGQ